tara:strand:+ start:803 stop:1414 length:612 start_codon:yes stop_codon:yes gene_type:complete
MNNLIQVIPVLTPEEVKFVNTELDKKEFSVSLIGFADDESGILSGRVDSNIRSSSGCCLNDDEEVAKVMHKGMNNALLEYRKRLMNIHSTFDGYPVPGGYMTSSNRELIQVLEYVKNQKYTWHTDASPMPKSKEYHRKISIILYLSDDFEGGTTQFVHKQFKPPIGHALIFPSNWCFPHCGAPVISGKKRVAVTWYFVNDLNV